LDAFRLSDGNVDEKNAVGGAWQPSLGGGEQMKRGIIVAAAAISMAGAASAHLLTASSQGAASNGTTRAAVPQEAAAPQAVQVPQLPSPTGSGAPRSEPNNKSDRPQGERRASVEVRKAPVPLQVAPRPPVYVPAVDTTEAYVKGEAGSSTKASALAPSATDDKVGEAAARKAIEADGYKGVEVLRKGDNGVWHAKALRGRTVVQLVVDSRGMVSTAD
jgi:hypothetical protein